MLPGQLGVIERELRSCSSNYTLNTTKVQLCNVTGIYRKMEHVLCCVYISRSVGVGLLVERLNVVVGVVVAAAAYCFLLLQA
jgi:hypothetical protein